MGGDTLAADIPSHWEFTTLGEVCRRGGGEIQTGPFGSQLHASDYVSVGVPSIMPTNIGDNRIVEDGIVRITETDAARLSQHRVQDGDIVYSRRGDVEKRALIRRREAGWLCGTGCLKVRLGHGVVDPVYASYFLGHPAIREWIVRHAIGATMPNLNTSIMRAVPFALPPLAEQRAIARILGALDDKIELNRKMNETLEAMARALFKSWFVDFDPVRAKAEGRAPSGMDAETAKLFPSEFVESEIGMIPSGWRVAYLSEIAGIASGKRPTERHDVASTTASVPLFGGGGVMAYVSEPLLQQRAILTGRVGTLGLLFRVTEPVWPSDNTLVIQPHRDFDFDLVRFHLERVDFASLNRGSTQPLLTQRDLGAQCFVHASEGARKAFAGIVEQWMMAVDRRKTETTKLSAIRDALLPRLLSGELSVAHVEDALEVKA